MQNTESEYSEDVIDSILDAQENGNWQKFESLEDACAHIKSIGDKVRKRKLDATPSE